MANLHYSTAYPALAPLASGFDDDAAEPIQQGAALNDDDDVIKATKQCKKRKLLEEVGLADQEEVVRAKVRKTQVVAEHAAQGFVIPLWAAGIQNTLTALSNTINHPVTGLVALSNRPVTGLIALSDAINHPVTGLATKVTALGNAINHPVTGLNAISQRLSDAATRGNLSVFLNNSNPIQPIANNEGEYPGENIWIQTVNEFERAKGNQLNALLTFYGLDVDGTLEVRRDRLRAHLQGDLVE